MAYTPKARTMLETLGFILEVTPGTTPAGDVTQIPCGVDTLSYQRGTFESTRNDGTRQRADMRLGRGSVTGAIPFEPSYSNFDTLWEALLGGTIVAVPFTTMTATTFTCAAADNSIADSGSGFVAAGIAEDDLIFVEGFTSANNNGIFKVSTVAAGKLVLFGSAITNEASGDTVTIRQVQLCNGIVERTFTCQRNHPTLAAGKAAHYKGSWISGMSVSMPIEGIATGSINLKGMDADESATAQTLAAMTEYYPYSGDYVTPKIDMLTGPDADNYYDFQKFDFNIANDCAFAYRMGSQTALEVIPSGKITADGSFAKLNAATDTELNWVKNGTLLQLVLPCVDPAGNKQYMIFPRALVTGVANAEQDGMRIQNVSFTALKDAEVTDITFAILSIAA